MKILVVEDDNIKLNSVTDFLNHSFNNLSIDCGRSVQSGVQLGVDNQYDLIILDMTIPNFDSSAGRNGGQSFKNGGEIIVRELLDEEIDFRCAVLTQYETFNNETIEEISERIKKRCGDKYLGYIKYNVLEENWKEELIKLIQYVENNNN